MTEDEVTFSIVYLDVWRIREVDILSNTVQFDVEQSLAYFEENFDSIHNSLR